MGSLTDAAPAAHDGTAARGAGVARAGAHGGCAITRDGLSTLVFLLPFLSCSACSRGSRSCARS